MATLNMNNLHCNGTSSAYGVYTCSLTYDSITRSGGTVTINNLKLNMTRQSSKYSTNRIAYCCAIGDTSNYINWNTQIKKSGGASAASYSLSLGSPSYNTTGTSIYIGIWVASTGASSDWTNFQHKVEHAFYPACPGAAPVWSTQPSIASRTETSITINRGTASYSPTYYYKLSSWGSWSTFSGSSATITGLSPNTPYTINIKANANGFDTSASNQSATTYAYPYISSTPGEVYAGNNQSVTLYNPLSRSVSVSMTCNGRTIGSGTTTGTSVSFGTSLSEAGIAVGSTGTWGTATYTSNYSGVTHTASNKFHLSESSCKPTWGSVTANNLITYEDNNSTIVNLTQNNQILIRGYSKWSRKVNYTGYPASSRYSASISKYQISINGGGWTDLSNTNMVDTGLTVGSAQTSVSVAVRAIDSRGYASDSLTRTVNTTAYSAPTGTINATRVGGYGPQITLRINPTWSISARNAGRATYSYSSDGGSTWSTAKEITVFNTDVDLTEEYANENEFRFRVYIIDSLGTSSSVINTSVPAGSPIMFVDSTVGGVGINCFPLGKGIYPVGEKLDANNPISTTNPGRLYGGGIQIHEVYSSSANGPASYGNLINIGGLGQSQFFIEWSGSQDTTNHITGRVWYRSWRDCTAERWSDWVEFIDSGHLKSYLLNYIYPVGSIYMSITNTSPASFLGGTWTNIYDRFLIGAGSGYGVTGTGGSTTHTLSWDEMPWHWHTVNDHSHWVDWETWANGNHNHTLGGNTSCVASGSSYARPRGASSGNWATSYDTSWPGDHAHRMTFNTGGSAPGTNAQGQGWAHNNMPPWYAVYMWRRTG